MWKFSKSLSFNFDITSRKFWQNFPSCLEKVSVFSLAARGSSARAYPFNFNIVSRQFWHLFLNQEEMQFPFSEYRGALYSLQKLECLYHEQVVMKWHDAC
jgi:hypothetical protein